MTGMGQFDDFIAGVTASFSGQGAIAWGLFGILMLGYWIMSLGGDRHHRWRRDRTNLSRLPVWRCKRCGAMASRRVKRESDVCQA